MLNEFESIPRPVHIEKALSYPQFKVDSKEYLYRVIKEATRLDKLATNKIPKLYLSYIIENARLCILEIDKAEGDPKTYKTHFDNIEWAIIAVRKN